MPTIVHARTAAIPHSNRSGTSPELLLRSCSDLRLDDHVGRKPESSLRLWPALLCNRGRNSHCPLQNDSEEWLSDKTRACPPGEGDEGPNALAFSEYRPFSFRKPISMVACFIDLLVNSKAMQPEKLRLADRAESESLAFWLSLESNSCYRCVLIN